MVLGLIFIIYLVDLGIYGFFRFRWCSVVDFKGVLFLLIEI